MLIDPGGVRPGAIAHEPSFRRTIGTRNWMNSKGTENVTLRGNEAYGTASEATERDATPRLRDKRREGSQCRPARGGAAAQRDAGQHDGLGSERGLATPSPDGKGENLTLSPSIMPPDS